ncbi:hypothetical protein JTB14_007135 [Gonioctena quinquepunctata]|nr:hypothetical protein JTB14_007135 [Gonioctena quinquepunctata]
MVWENKSDEWVKKEKEREEETPKKGMDMYRRGRSAVTFKNEVSKEQNYRKQYHKKYHVIFNTRQKVWVEEANRGRWYGYDSQNFGAESYTDNYQEHQSNISDHTNDQYDFGYSETQLNQYENFQDFPIGPISFDPPINQSIDPTSELQAQVQALNISDNLNPNLNFPNKCSYN